MTACEKCWGDAFLRSLSNPDRSQSEHYRALLKERQFQPCTPDQQRGIDKITPSETHD